MADKGMGNGALMWLVALAVALLGGLLWYTQRPASQIAEEIVASGAESPTAVVQAPVAAEPAAPEAAPSETAVPEAPMPEAAPETLPESAAPTEAGAPPAPAAEPATDAVADAAQDPAEQPPVFSTVRVTPQGNALVAGQAEPGAAVSVIVDGAAAVQTQANDRGDFVAMFDLPPSAAPRVLSLSQQVLGNTLSSSETVVLEPIAPAQVAEAQPAAPVAEAAAPTAILLSDTGARVMQSASALPAGAVSIAAITYTPDGGVQLSGLGASGATVRLYLNNALRGEAVVTASGAWVSTLRGVQPGLYTLRADQIAPDGAVSSRFETPFQRESLEALAAVMKPQAVAAGAAQPPAITEAGTPAPPPAAALATPAGPVNVTVQPGFTLWQIARDNFGDGVQYVKVYEANRDQIRDPDLIYPGQVFKIPGQ